MEKGRSDRREGNEGRSGKKVYKQQRQPSPDKDDESNRMADFRQKLGVKQPGEKVSRACLQVEGTKSSHSAT